MIYVPPMYRTLVAIDTTDVPCTPPKSTGAQANPATLRVISMLHPAYKHTTQFITNKYYTRKNPQQELLPYNQTVPNTVRHTPNFNFSSTRTVPKDDSQTKYNTNTTPKSENTPQPAGGTQARKNNRYKRNGGSDVILKASRRNSPLILRVSVSCFSRAAVTHLGGADTWVTDLTWQSSACSRTRWLG